MLIDCPIIVFDTYTRKLRDITYSVHHSPNCPSPFQVRLIGHGMAILDNLHRRSTKDILGYGQSIEDAARDAWHKKFTKGETSAA
ncbi:hypothetical protein HOB10_01960 [Candidatus Parcubacteria bacterium]|jgi:hypothetical protein|nr:hypothetical protein [Candidatus Parcubacteria bacterium]